MIAYVQLGMRTWLLHKRQRSVLPSGTLHRLDQITVHLTRPRRVRQHHDVGHVEHRQQMVRHDSRYVEHVLQTELGRLHGIL